MADEEMADARPSSPADASAPSTSEQNGVTSSDYRDRSDVPSFSGFSCTATLTGHERAVTTVKFSHEGTKICSGSADNTARIWDLETGECLHTLKGHLKVIVRVVHCLSEVFSYASTHDLRCSILKHAFTSANRGYQMLHGLPATMTTWRLHPMTTA